MLVAAHVRYFLSEHGGRHCESLSPHSTVFEAAEAHTSTSKLCERTVDVVLMEGHFLRHLIRLQERVRSAIDVALEMLDDMGAQVLCRPEQSLYVWATFSHFDDARDLTRLLLPKGFMIAPGHIFSPKQSRINPWTRLNVAYLNDPAFKSTLQQ